jgi:aldehyde dehydrogenase (NAD+)
VFNVVTGPGSVIGHALVTHPGVDKISFTGETATGAGILKASADDIKRVSLELGGKSPNIVFADADVERAARSSVLAVFGNCGPGLLRPEPGLRRGVGLRPLSSRLSSTRHRRP